MPTSPEPTFFASPEEWGGWLESNHETEKELWVGYHKVHTGKAALTWAQAVREALRFGWIDGQRRSIDAERHMQRFTPRNPRSRWSAVNVRIVGELEQAGLLREAGRRAFAARNPDEVAYSTSDRPASLPAEYDAQLRSHPVAAAFWDTTPPSYRKVASFWVSSAKREETRARRLAALIEDCSAGRRMTRFTAP